MATDGLSQWRLGFDPKLTHMRSGVDKVALDKSLPAYFCFPRQCHSTDSEHSRSTLKLHTHGPHSRSTLTLIYPIFVLSKMRNSPILWTFHTGMILPESGSLNGKGFSNFVTSKQSKLRSRQPLFPSRVCRFHIQTAPTSNTVQIPLSDLLISSTSVKHRSLNHRNVRPD